MGARAQKAVAEGLYDAGHGVEGYQPLVFGGGGTQWVNNGGGIHHELYAKRNQKGQIAVFGGQCGNDQPKAQAQERHEQHQEGEEQRPKRELEFGANSYVVEHHAYKQQHLYAKAHQVAHHN